jgi:hypothetical protein
MSGLRLAEGPEFLLNLLKATHRGATPEQPSVWTTVEFQFPEEEAGMLADALAEVLEDKGWLVLAFQRERRDLRCLCRTRVPLPERRQGWTCRGRGLRALGRRARAVARQGRVRVAQPAMRGNPYSTAKWQQLRRIVLQRDGGPCQIRGRRCIGIATSVHHVQRSWVKCLGRAEIPHRTMHEARHTAITDFLRRTGNLKLAQIRAGHADIGTTANIYAHLDTSHLETALRALNEE